PPGRRGRRRLDQRRRRRSVRAVNPEPFGTTPGGVAVERHTLANARVEVKVITYGGIVQSIVVPDRAGRRANVALGFADLESYVARNDAYFGCIAGRFAGRIARGEFALDGVAYRLA